MAVNEAQRLQVEPRARLAVGARAQRGLATGSVLLRPAPPGIHLPHDIPARTADIKDLGDESPESHLWSECPFAAVRAALAPGQPVIGKHVAKEFVKLTQRSESLDFPDQLARTTAKKQRPEGLKEWSIGGHAILAIRSIGT